MADNTTLNTGSGGDVIATDDIAGVKFQRVKVTFGADGVANDVDDAAGKRLPVAAIGDVASGSADSGNPVKVGGIAKTTNPTPVTDGQRIAVLLDKVGRQIATRALRDLVVNQTTAITGTGETTILTAVASVFLDITHLSITNSSATAVTVTIKDATAGTTRAVYDIPANGGIVLHFDPGFTQSAVNNNWTATVSSGVSTIHINVNAVKNV